MKKILCIILALPIIFCGCSNKKTDESKDSNINNEINISSEETVEVENFNPWECQPTIQEFYEKLKSKHGDNLSELKISDWYDSGKIGEFKLKLDILNEEIKITAYEYNDIYGIWSLSISYSNNLCHDKITGDILSWFADPFVLYCQYQPDYSSASHITDLFENEPKVEKIEAYGSEFYKVYSGSEFIKNDSKYKFSKSYSSKNGGSDTWAYYYDFTIEPIENSSVYNELKDLFTDLAF